MRTILMYNVGRDLRATFEGKVVRLILYLFIFEYYFLQHCLEYKIIILCYSLWSVANLYKKHRQICLSVYVCIIYEISIKDNKLASVSAEIKILWKNEDKLRKSVISLLFCYDDVLYFTRN